MILLVDFMGIDFVLVDLVGGTLLYMFTRRLYRTALGFATKPMHVHGN